MSLLYMSDKLVEDAVFTTDAREVLADAFQDFGHKEAAVQCASAARTAL